jgi:hypothetical protein
MSGRALVIAWTSAGVLGASVGPGVAAGFTSSSTAATGTQRAASLDASIAVGTDDLGAPGGVGGSSYTLSVVALARGNTTRRYTTLTNTGSVTESLSGAVTATSVTGSLTVAVDACTVPWSAGLCSGSVSSLRTAVAVSSAPNVSYGSVAVGGARYLRFSLTSTSTLSTATVTAAATPSATATGDRTAG